MTCINSNGDEVTFGHHLELIEEFDTSGLAANVSYSESQGDGSFYSQTRLSNRELEIPFLLLKNNTDPARLEEKRSELFKVFNPKANPIKLDFTTEGGSSYYLMANVESSPVFSKGFENDNHRWSKGLIQLSSNDPFIYRNDITKVDLAKWNGSFEFPIEINPEGMELGYRSNALIVNVINDGQTDTGMLIRFRANGTVTNPSVLDVNTREFIKLKTTMLAGDIIEISTYARKKRVELIRNSVRSNIFNQLDIESSFLQLAMGDNLLRYDAETNLESLEVSILFIPRLLGV